MSKIHFIIVGEGGQKELYKKMIKEMDLQSYFTLTGKISYDEIQNFYQLSDIFVLPSTLKVDIQEQFPYVVLEALSCGKPVIGSDVGGIPEAIGDAGIICPPGDYIKLSEAIRILVEDERLRIDMSKLARKRAEEYFSCEVNSVKLYDLITNL
ncbi:MAG: glycosyltransferase family 4 protein [Thermodesulfovibrio sp.]|nr:glycosyltransferase family 4 protein [Thermodesulfovibrio sp.]